MIGSVYRYVYTDGPHYTSPGLAPHYWWNQDIRFALKEGDLIVVLSVCDCSRSVLIPNGAVRCLNYPFEENEDFELVHR